VAVHTEHVFAFHSLLEEKVLYGTLKGSIYVFGTSKSFYTEPFLRVQ